MKISVFWNEFPFKGIPEAGRKEILFHYLVTNNLNNEQFKLYFSDTESSSLDILFSPVGIVGEDNSIINSSQFSELDGIFILAELDWHGNKMTDFYGVKVVQKLRLNNVSCPIFICSFMPESYLIEEEQFKILNFRGHYFIHLPKGLTEDLEICSLDEMELLDVQSFFCNTEGLISSIFHNKSNARGKKLDDAKNYLINEVYGKILNINGLLEKSRIVALSHIEKIKRISNENEFSPFLEQNEAELLTPYKVDSEQTANLIHFFPEGAWEMLILEDNEQQIKDLINLVNERGKVKIHIANTYNDAQKIIREDRANKIIIVICDYRLEKEGNIKGKQGYSFVQWLAKQNRFNEIFVYSGLARSFQNKTFEHFGIRVHSKNKNELFGIALEEFVNDIVYSGNKTWEVILKRPTAKQWNELIPFYSFFRSNAKYDVWEDDISIVSKAIIDEIVALIENIEVNLDFENRASVKTFNDKVETELVKCQIATLKNLTAKTYSQKPYKKGMPLSENDIIVTLTSDKKAIRSYKNPKKYFDEFKNKLIARRVFIYLHFRYGINRWTILNLLKQGTVFENKEDSLEQEIKKIDNKIVKEIRAYLKKSNSDIRLFKEVLNILIRMREDIEKTLKKEKEKLKQIPFNLAFQDTDYPGRLLVEEKNWLNKLNLLNIRKLNVLTEELEQRYYNFLSENLSSINIKSKSCGDFMNTIDGWVKESDTNSLTKYVKIFYSLYSLKRSIDALSLLVQDKNLYCSLIQDMQEVVNHEITSYKDFELSLSDFKEFLNSKCNK